MPTEPLVECSFFIPICRDKNLADGALHEVAAWEWLDNQLDAQFGASTIDTGLYQGFYRDPDTQERVSDQSYRFILAMPREAVDQLRAVLAAACVIFAQKCIYLSVAGYVEFIGPDDHETNGNLH